MPSASQRAKYASGLGRAVNMVSIQARRSCSTTASSQTQPIMPLSCTVNRSGLARSARDRISAMLSPLTHQQNSGAAFSFLAGASGWQRWFFVVLASAVSAVIIAWLWRIRQEGPIVLTAGLSLVLGGAIGNLIDRAMLGSVTDFIQVWFGNWAFPSFNIADSAITVGAALLIIDALFLSGRDTKP